MEFPPLFRIALRFIFQPTKRLPDTLVLGDAYTTRAAGSKIGVSSRK